MSTSSRFHEISSFFGSAVQASVDDKVAVYLASISLAGGATIVADNDKAAEACHRSDCVCVMSRPRPWSSSTDSVGVRQAFDDDESSGSSYSTSEDVHDCSASKRPMNKAWSPNEENVRFPSRPQTFYSANEQIPAYWLQVMPTPQPSISEEQTATEDEVNTPAPDAVFPMPPRAETSRRAMNVFNDINDPHEIEIPDEIAYMTTAALTPTENASTPLPVDGEDQLGKKVPLWRRLSSRNHTSEARRPSSAKNGWRTKMQFIVGRLLRRAA